MVFTIRIRKVVETSHFYQVLSSLQKDHLNEKKTE